MNKDKGYLSLLTSLLVLLVIIGVGCITVYEKGPADLKPGSPVTPSAPAVPVIKSFTAAPTSINAGQQSQLSWEVSGATKVEITPAVGTVEPVSMVLVMPATTTTYTLTAINTAGNSTATVTVSSSQAMNRPDLVVTDIQMGATKVVYYSVKNIGNDTAKGGARAYLYVDGIKNATDYIETLAPGQERRSSFSNFEWDTITSSHGVAPTISQFAMKVCADVENVMVENDEANNCRTIIWGDKLNYSLLNYTHLAWWYSGAGKLQLPLPEDNAKGYAGVVNVPLEDGQSHGSVLLTRPENVPNGWIKGVFGDFYTSELREAKMAYMKLLDMSKFTAQVGFAGDTAANSRARFIFEVEDDTRSIVLSREMTVTSDGKLDLFEVDLSSLAGKYGAFILKVESIDSAEKVRAVWVDPRVLQP